MQCVLRLAASWCFHKVQRTQGNPSNGPEVKHTLRRAAKAGAATTGSNAPASSIASLQHRRCDYLFAGFWLESLPKVPLIAV